MDYLIDLHIQGGLVFMIVLFGLLAINTIIFIGLVFSWLAFNKVYTRTAKAIVHIGTFAGAWGTFSTIVGLFVAFSAIQAEKEIIPFHVISGGMKVGLLTIIYGLLVLSLSLAEYIVIKLLYQHHE